ncbi:MAG: Ecotin precursor [Bacteroidota bacterium]|jgi:serine protease inhibitor ecotin
MKKILSFLVCFNVALQLQSQTKTIFPEPKEGYKKVELQLPKVDNTKNYKVQITFSFDANVGECSNASFSLNPRIDIIKSYGTPLDYTRPYFSVEKEFVDILEMNATDCKSKKRIKRKVMCDVEYLIDYSYDYAIPFYIPNDWYVEYKIWRTENDFTTVK